MGIVIKGSQMNVSLIVPGHTDIRKDPTNFLQYVKKCISPFESRLGATKAEGIAIERHMRCLEHRMSTLPPNPAYVTAKTAALLAVADYAVPNDIDYEYIDHLIVKGKLVSIVRNYFEVFYLES